MSPKKNLLRDTRFYLPALARGGALLLVCLLIDILPAQRAFAGQPSEIEIKLVYLYNFTKFVSWPEHAFQSESDPFRLCIIGEMPPQELTTVLRSKSTAGRRFDVLLLNDSNDISMCHIAFLHRVSRTQIGAALQATPDSPTLTVSDISGFAAKEGIIEFVRDEEQRIRIRINLVNAHKRQLNISAKLLETAINTERYAK